MDMNKDKGQENLQQTQMTGMIFYFFIVEN